MIRLLVAMIFCIGTFGCAESPTSGSDTMNLSEQEDTMKPSEQEVYATYEAINEALIKKDRAALERLFDKDLTFTHMSGKVQTRKEFLDEIMDGTLNYYKIETKSYDIQMQGDSLARMSVTHTLTAKVYGSSGAWTMDADYTYEKRGDTWVRIGNR
jgi:ketosteroid isomerase-like protein